MYGTEPESQENMHLFRHRAAHGDGVDRFLVLQEEHHPSAMGIGQSKEGFSVFGIFNQCVSSMGKRLLRLWFRRPIINLTAITDRQVSSAAFSLTGLDA